MTPQQIYSNVPIENLFAIYQFKEAALIIVLSKVYPTVTLSNLIKEASFR